MLSRCRGHTGWERGALWPSLGTVPCTAGFELCVGQQRIRSTAPRGGRSQKRRGPRQERPLPWVTEPGSEAFSAEG